MGGHQSKKKAEYWNAEVHRIRNAEAAKPWELVHQCSLNEWSKHEAIRWGFDPLVNYTSRLEQRYQPWTTNGRFFHVTIPCPETQDCDLPAKHMYATMSITEKRNTYTVQCISLPKSYFKEKLSFVDVIAYRRDFAVVEVALDYGKIDLYLVDMKQDTAVFLHSESCVDRPYVLECCLSPDLSCMLIKPNDVYRSIYGNQAVNDTIKCIQISNAKNQLCGTLLQGRAKDVSFAFDPRFKHSRIALGNVMKNDQRMLQLFDLETNTVIKEAELQSEGNPRDSDSDLAQNLVFSPDGSYIACLMRPGCQSYNYQTPSTCYFLHLVNIYQADSLSIMRVINHQNTEIMTVISLAPAAIFPMFSEDGAYIAVAYCATRCKQPEFTAFYGMLQPYDKVDSVLLYKVPPIMSLGSICRSKIRKLVKQDHVRFLPLPSALKRFLLFVPQDM